MKIIIIKLIKHMTTTIYGLSVHVESMKTVTFSDYSATAIGVSWVSSAGIFGVST